jgi:hypothetical protein
MNFFKGIGRSLRDEITRPAGSLPLPLEITIPNLALPEVVWVKTMDQIRKRPPFSKWRQGTAKRPLSLSEGEGGTKQPTRASEEPPCGLFRVYGKGAVEANDVDK